MAQTIVQDEQWKEKWIDDDKKVEEVWKISQINLNCGAIFFELFIDVS